VKYNYDSGAVSKYVEVIKKALKGQEELSLEDQLILNEGHMDGAVILYQSNISPSQRKAYFLEKVIRIRIQLIKKKYC